MKELNEMDDAFKKALSGFETPAVMLSWKELHLGILENNILRLKKQNYFLKIAVGILGLLAVASIARMIWGEKLAVEQTNAYLATNTVSEKDTVFVERMLVKYDTVYLKQVVWVSNKKQPLVSEKEIAYEQRATNTNNADFFSEKKSVLVENKTYEAAEHKKEIIETEAQQTEKLMAKRQFENVKPISLKTYKPKFKLPKIKYELPFDQIREFYRKEIKTPLIERLYVQAEADATLNQLIVKGITNSKNNGNGNVIGANVGIQLSSRVGLRTGLFQEDIDFPVPDNNIHTISAENYLTTPTFIYRTALGNLIIPTNDLEYKLTLDDKLTVEPESHYSVVFWKIPLLLTYNLQEKNIRFMGGYHSFQPYVVGGGYLQLPLRQNLEAEIYAPDGEETHATLTDFKGISNLAFGGTLGLGGSLYLGGRTSLLSEMYVSRNFTNMVSNEYYNSTPWGGGLKLGLRMNLK